MREGVLLRIQCHQSWGFVCKCTGLNWIACSVLLTYWLHNDLLQSTSILKPCVSYHMYQGSFFMFFSYCFHSECSNIASWASWGDSGGAYWIVVSAEIRVVSFRTRIENILQKYTLLFSTCCSNELYFWKMMKIWH